MTHEWNHPEDRLDAYIDNLLAGVERAQFEQLLSRDSNLAVMAKRGREMNAQLRHHFEPPPVPAWATARRLAEHHGHSHGNVESAVERNTEAEVVHRIPRIAPRPIARQTESRRWTRHLAVAAAIVLVGVGTWLVWQTVRSPGSDGYDATEWRTFEQAYAVLEQPAWVCESDEVFAATFDGRFGQPLLFKDPPGEATMAGLAYCHSISRDTVCMVGSADSSSRIVVFIDRLEKDTQPVLPAESGLHLFRRELGQLVLYEVSPKDHPILLDWFYIP